MAVRAARAEDGQQVGGGRDGVARGGEEGQWAIVGLEVTKLIHLPFDRLVELYVPHICI